MLVLGIKGVGSAEIEIGGAGVEKGFCANLPLPLCILSFLPSSARHLLFLSYHPSCPPRRAPRRDSLPTASVIIVFSPSSTTSFSLRFPSHHDYYHYHVCLSLGKGVEKPCE